MVLTCDQIRDLYYRTRNSARRRGVMFTVTLGEFSDLTFPLSCPILGIPLRLNRGRVFDDSYSVDRIDSSLGYVAGNLMIISFKANRIKNNATIEEMQRVSEFCVGDK